MYEICSGLFQEKDCMKLSKNINKHPYRSFLTLWANVPSWNEFLPQNGLSLDVFFLIRAAPGSNQTKELPSEMVTTMSSNKKASIVPLTNIFFYSIITEGHTLWFSYRDIHIAPIPPHAHTQKRGAPHYDPIN